MSGLNRPDCGASSVAEEKWFSTLGRHFHPGPRGSVGGRLSRGGRLRVERLEDLLWPTLLLFLWVEERKRDRREELRDAEEASVIDIDGTRGERNERWKLRSVDAPARDLVGVTGSWAGFICGDVGGRHVLWRVESERFCQRGDK